ncbi:AAA family ATPase [Actinospongicola halichondriae]|uniref:AAA family ATPase n=1 Tax=Actinospongicola halichondriae TaxID=3236844 RepID=UPI003D41903C
MTIVVLSDASSLEEAVRAAVGDSVAVETFPLSTGVRVDADDLAVVIIDGARDLDQALRIAKDFDDRRQDVTVVLGAPFDSDVVARAMQVGVRDLLAPGSSDDRIREAVKRAIEVADRRREAIRGADATTDNRLIMVMSPKGGAGKTTIATNLAVGLAKRAPKEVALIDGDLQFGDVGNALRLLAETNIRDAIAGGLQDVTEVKVHLTPHRSGLFALCAPDLPGVADEITSQAFTRAVAMLGDEFRFVVVDTDPGLGERTLAVMDHATDLVFVAATDVASVRGLHKTIDALDSIGMTSHTRHFVLNRSDAKVGLEISDIAATIGMDPDVMIPSHRSLPVSMNQGTPILEMEDPSPAAGPLWELVDRFLPDPDGDKDESDAGRKPSGGLLRRRN